MADPHVSSAGATDAATDPIDAGVGKLLTVGTLIVVGLVAVGVVLATLAGERPIRQSGGGVHLERVLADIVALRPEGFLGLGVVLTITLPAARVVMAMLAYGRAGDRRMVLIAGAVMLVLAASVAIAVLTQPLG